jgi:hypothetical protein
MTYFLGALLALALLLAVYEAFKVRDLEGDLEEARTDADRNAFEAARLRQHAEDVLVPLTWTWDHVEADPVEGFGPRLRAYLVSCYQEVQRALLKDDVEMTEAMVEARSHHPQPRRLPTRPQVPPYLASPADLVGAPIDWERNKVAIEGERIMDPVLYRPADFDVVTTPKPAMPERYFRRMAAGSWEETDANGYDDAMSNPTLWARVHKVSAGSSPESVPEEIRSLIWAPPRGEDLPQPVALDDEA